MKKVLFFICSLLTLMSNSCSQQDTPQDSTDPSKYTSRGWNILSSHRENGLRTIDTAAAYGANYIELSHYQLVHFLKDLKKEKNRDVTNFFVDEAHKRGIDKVFLWDHAFYEMDYYPDRFKVKASGEEDFTHHATHFEGGLKEQLNLDDPEFWQWVYQDYDSLLSLAPDIDGITLTFIETGTYVIYQHSEKLQTGGEKIAALVDSLAGYFIDKKGLDLTIRTFIYNQFEKQTIIDALKLIKHPGIKVMIKMVPHDWFMTYPYQDFVQEIPFPIIIEYDGGMEYAGENIIANSFVKYFTDAFQHYNQFDNVIGYCVRSDRFEETAATGTPGEINLYTLSRLAENPSLSADEITEDFIVKQYGKGTLPYLKPAFDSAQTVIMASMYTLGLHTGNHSRLNFHRKNIYQSHTTGEWYAPDDQMYYVGHDVNKTFHNYKDIINALSFPAYKTDTAGLKRDIAWVIDSNWLQPQEAMTPDFLLDILTEKQYAIDLAKKNLELVSTALPFIKDRTKANTLYHIFERTVIFAEERKAMAQAVYGYRLWCKDEQYRTPELQALIWEGLDQADDLITVMEHYPVHVPLGQWRWHRDRESYDIYYKAITNTAWEKLGLEKHVVPKPQ
ncbi:MAG: hypothetical protein AAFO07_25080 [Bacteroidota bacterium]